MRYYILDDDVASRKILSRIIIDEYLGEVVGESDNPLAAELEIINTNPNIVLIDLLMPAQDGIETVHNLKKRGFNGKFIMISQIENKEMVAEAYKEGIEYFIHKPINRVEVSTIVSKVLDQTKMQYSLNKIKESLFHMNNSENTTIINKNSHKNLNNILQSILADLGIIGEAGSNDLYNIIEYLYNNKQRGVQHLINSPLKDIFSLVLTNNRKKPEDKDLKAFEQRIRRAVNQAMTNLASLGITDYAHPSFESYATKFFDFNDIRLKMRELDKGDTSKAARINLRKFIYALYNEMIERLE